MSGTLVAEDHFNSGEVAFTPSPHGFPNLGISTFRIITANVYESTFGPHQWMVFMRDWSPIAIFSTDRDPRAPEFVKKVYRGSFWNPELHLDNFFVINSEKWNPFFTPWIDLNVDDRGNPLKAILRVNPKAILKKVPRENPPSLKINPFIMTAHRFDYIRGYSLPSHFELEFQYDEGIPYQEEPLENPWGDYKVRTECNEHYDCFVTLRVYRDPLPGFPPPQPLETRTTGFIRRGAVRKFFYNPYICPTCGEQLPEALRYEFCPFCGNPQQP